MSGEVVGAGTGSPIPSDPRSTDPHASGRTAAAARAFATGGPLSVLARNLLVTRRTTWVVVLVGFLEPVLYLLAMGFGLGQFIGGVDAGGGEVSYAAFVAPGLLAVAAMNGAIYESTWNVFFKLKYAKTYQSMLATTLSPRDVALGEIFSALARGALYAMGFLVVMQAMGLNRSWTAVLALPAVVLVASGFAAFGMGITCLMKTMQQLDLINVVLLPMFLLSATFYPITVYPEPLQWVIKVLPLWHGVELVRDLTLGAVGWGTLVHVGYYVALIAVGMTLTTRVLDKRFLR